MHRSDVGLDADATYPMHQYDARNSSYNPDGSVPETITPYWRYSTCREVEGIVTVAGGSVYPGRITIDGQDGSRGDGEWDAYQRPAVVGDTLYVGGKTLDAYDAKSGDHRWTVETAGNAGGVSAPIVRDGIVYFTGNVTDATVYAVDAATGTKQRLFTPDAECNVAPATDGKAVFAVDEGGTVYAIDASSGEELWRYRTESFHNGGPPTVANGTLYVGVRAGVFAIDTASGDVQWSTRTPKSEQASIAVAEDTVFVTESICQALAIDDGTERWRNESVTSGGSGGACCVTSDTVLVGGETLDALSRSDGTHRWEFKPRRIAFSDHRAGRIPFAPAAVDGSVFVATGAGDLYALGPAANNA